ncbi:MAG: outer membrane protein assembly factor [Fidelibacterota bacterium]
MDYFKLNTDSGIITKQLLVWLLLLLLPHMSHGQISGGKRYNINSIVVKGNRRFDDKEITKIISLSRSNFFPTQRLSRTMIKTDRLRIKTFYQKNGFLNCAVEDSLYIDKDQQVDIFFTIDEGEQFLLSEIKIIGNKLFEKEKIHDWLELDIEEPYNPLQVREAVKRVEEHYENNGKPFAYIRDSLIFNDNKITMRLNIREGRTMLINDIIVKNNNLVKTSVIKRELVIRNDDLYSKKKIERSKKYLLNLGLFTSVNINHSDIDTTDNKIDLIVYVREQDMRYWEFNTGIVQREGLGTEVNTTFIVSGLWRHKNINNSARGISISSEVGVNPYNFTRRPDFNADISYIEPWAFGFRSTGLIKLFIDDLEQKQYEYTKYGLETSLIINPDKRNYMKAGFEFSEIDNKFESIDSTVFQEIEREKERAIIFDYNRDRRNDFMFPSNGHLLTVSAKITSSILGGTEDYFKLETSYSEYFQFFRKIVLAYRAKIGYLAPYASDNSAPQYEKYYLGGANSMRGWENLMFLSQKGEDGSIIAQRKRVKVLTNFEVRFPIYWIIGGEIFFDGGNLVSDIKSLRDSQYRWNFGFGLTVATPLGPARVDLARPLFKDEKRWVPQFAISYAF